MKSALSDSSRKSCIKIIVQICQDHQSQQNIHHILSWRTCLRWKKWLNNYLNNSRQTYLWFANDSEKLTTFLLRRMTKEMFGSSFTILNLRWMLSQLWSGKSSKTTRSLSILWQKTPTIKEFAVFDHGKPLFLININQTDRIIISQL